MNFHFDTNRYRVQVIGSSSTRVHHRQIRSLTPRKNPREDEEKGGGGGRGGEGERRGERVRGREIEDERRRGGERARFYTGKKMKERHKNTARVGQRRQWRVGARVTRKEVVRVVDEGRQYT